ncbi:MULTISPECIES: histidinol-phosphatase HisJ [Solibacillus]|uniref:Histidinol-phosphatase n=1 Tax=Solibacillus merdavium TaxID=2762218 RepID=A0ABR8XK52_9BACL|nr:histidinol-phosphatase HisJ [Solibacillus merdavium]MBD8032320.1 histidinol-phosphatase HisJ [Solibacillus merdavium]
MMRDGHIHTPFCPHGSTDSFEEYIEKAIESGFKEISFTEHAPLPDGFIDPTPDKDSGMDKVYLKNYLHQLKTLKEHYQSKIIINIGLEVDYIIGFEQQTRQFLNEFGPFLDDAILSVHFLQTADEYVCIDFSDEVYLQFANKVGGIAPMYELYYETVKKSILADLGPFKPKRIGHPTLIHKFQLAHSKQIDDSLQIKEILILMKQHHYELDFNSAGLSKPFCKEPYPPLPFVQFAKELKIPIIFGSDAHTAQHLHQHYEVLQQKIIF